jgi:hypothetical protein
MTHNAVLTIAGNVTLSTPYTIAGSSNLTVLNGTIITSNGKVWPNSITFSGPTVTNTHTLNGNLTILGSYIIPSGYNNILNQTGTNTLSCNGIVNSGYWQLVSTCAIRLTGGSLPAASTANSHNFRELLFDGNVSLSGAINTNTTRIEIISGTVTGNVDLTINTSSITLNTDGIIWRNVFLGVASAILSSKLTSNGTITLPDATLTFSGGFGLETNFLVFRRSVNFQSGIEYIINNGLTGLSIAGGFQSLSNIYVISSTSPSVRAILTLKNGAICNTILNFTRIDSSGGRTINTFNGTVTDCINVRRFTDLQTVSSGFIN